MSRLRALGTHSHRGVTIGDIVASPERAISVTAAGENFTAAATAAASMPGSVPSSTPYKGQRSPASYTVAELSALSAASRSNTPSPLRSARSLLLSPVQGRRGETGRRSAASRVRLRLRDWKMETVCV